MPVFAYQAVAWDGKLEHAELPASDEVELEKILALRQLVLVKAKPCASRRASGGKIKPHELAELARYVAITCRGGLPLVESLEDFASMAPSPAVQSVLRAVVCDVRQGFTLSQAFERHPRAFDDAVLSMTRAGESSGAMEEVMRRLGEQLDFQIEVRSKVKGALIYPAMLGVAVLGLIILLITFLLPKIVGMLAQNDVQMPAPTRVLLAISGFITGHWPWLLGGLVAAIAGFKFLGRTKSGAMAFNRVLLAIPVVGKLANLGAQTRFVATLRTLLSAGVEAVSALEMAADSCGAPFLTGRLRSAGQLLRQGKTFSESLGSLHLLHPLVMRMVQLGERSGRMDESLDTCTVFFGTEVPKMVRKTIAVLEPLIICFAGISVAFILLATLLPVFSMYSSV